MGLLTERWMELDYSEDTFYRAVTSFKADLDFTVGRYYSWLTGELYMIEGELGWCPGFRDCIEDYYMPPKTTSAKSQMTNFLQVLDNVQPDMSIKDTMEEAICGEPSTKYARWLRRYLASVKEDWTGSKENYLVNKVYGLIASVCTEYALGAARIYRDLWLKKFTRNIAFILAGLLKIYCVPPDRIGVAAETVKRKRDNALLGFDGQWLSTTKGLILTEEAC